MTTGSQVINNFRIISPPDAHTDAVNIQYSHTSGAPAGTRERVLIYSGCVNMLMNSDGLCCHLCHLSRLKQELKKKDDGGIAGTCCSGKLTLIKPNF